MSTPPLFSDETKPTLDKQTLEREQSEEKIQLREQIAQIRSQLIELAHDAIIVRDPASTLMYWNRGDEELYGWTPQEAVGQVTHSLLSTRFPVPSEAVDALLATGEQWEGELIHTTKDGRQVVVESRQVLLFES